MTTPTVPWTGRLDGLPLVAETSPDWFAAATRDLDALLVDHAHCELKAASTALSLMGRFADDARLVDRMTALAYEEMAHFRQVHERVIARGGALTPPRPDRYVRQLRDRSFRSQGGVGAKADVLLAAALVEARSCERFRILAEGFAEGPVAGLDEQAAADLGLFYLRLADAEGRHWELFRELAMRAAEPAAVERRLGELAEFESDLVAILPLEPRMH